VSCGVPPVTLRRPNSQRNGRRGFPPMARRLSTLLVLRLAHVCGNAQHGYRLGWSTLPELAEFSSCVWFQAGRKSTAPEPSMEPRMPPPLAFLRFTLAWQLWARFAVRQAVLHPSPHRLGGLRIAG
jgi:hypothetical protein